ncbi:MAG: succinylglutamate desuccinylase [Gemmatimonadetes bacterium]|jgi:predicted deacylase|nr:succinylglutamate desuccinylase [Gemmatimonadota bacterium]MBT5059490.1 succinylglutamate desuccinylase [Gemmatimonadota bacterium]MBT5146785.1 succinylglutamate desuccinylase [Gemmatimonadota bacterium]MBT5590074.1 succinylglutamate desuccinylase [Gemmatimonadota bacterium]MBT5961731.1 succinylglutamate desuccinylase [Gemmatimonadota bacterium]
MQLKTRVFQGVSDGPHLLITGGVHGDEFESMSAMRRLIRDILPAFLQGKLTLVPVVNEAAFLRGTRAAEDDLDLARTCPGDPNGSITERTADALSTLIRSADYYIDLHTGGNIMEVWPMSGYGLVPDVDVLDTQRRMAQAFNLPFVWGTNCALDGRSLSVARDAKVPAIYTEYMGAGRCHRDGVQAYYDGCLNVMGELGMIDRQPRESVVLHTIEDNRPDAGHMQVCNPSPLTGLFEPRVSLGAHVVTGQIIGVVSDVMGDRIVEVASREAGIVLTLRVFSRVHEGDALAVIVEV